MNRRFGMAVVCVALVWGSLSCRTSTEPTLLACSDPSISNLGGVLITVGSGTAPRFSWSPKCNAYSLVVTDDTGSVMWGVLADSGNALAPPVDYGVVPTGHYTQIRAPLTLRAGKQYAVGVYRYYFTTPTPSDVLGAILFIP